jgi:hypothetical protein
MNKTQKETQKIEEINDSELIKKWLAEHWGEILTLGILGIIASIVSYDILTNPDIANPTMFVPIIFISAFVFWLLLMIEDPLSLD